jgi:hypothetical protein
MGIGRALYGLLTVALVVFGAEAQPATDSRTAAFLAECKAKAEAAEKANTMTVTGKDGWLYLGKELRHVSAGRFWGEDAAHAHPGAKPEDADPLAAILDFKEQLDKAGILLIVVPVPPKAIVYADMVADAVNRPIVPRLDQVDQEFYQLLREKGVTVLDLTDEFMKGRANDRPDQRVYCKSDTHWSPSACELAAQRIAEVCRTKLGLAASAGPNPYRAETRPIETTGDLERALHGDAGTKETLLARIVTVSGADPKVTETVDKASPILLIGDSHCLVFHAGGDMLANGAGLVDQLAFDLGIPVDLLGVRGSGATPARVNLFYRVNREPQYLPGKKVVVWCFSAREFTESADWRKVPIAKPK